MENNLTTPQKEQTLRRRALYVGVGVIVLAVVLRLLFGGGALLENPTVAGWLTYLYTGVMPTEPEASTEPPTEPPTEACN